MTTVQSSKKSHTYSIDDRRRGVSFCPVVTVRYIFQSSSTMSNEEKSSLYLSQSEIIQIYRNAKKLASTHGNVSANGSLQMDHSFRGLELSISRERARNSFIARRAIIKYQKQFLSFASMDNDRLREMLAAVSTRLSECARVIALEAARIDMIRAYYEKGQVELSSTLNIATSPVEIISFPRVHIRRRVSPKENVCEAPRKRSKRTPIAW